MKELEGDYEIWWKICDLLPNDCSMTRTCLKMCKVDVSSTATCAKFQGTAKSPLFYLYSALFQLHIADKGRFADQKSYFNKRWWEENYKPALFAADEALKLMKEDDYSLHRLLTYIISYCRAVILVLVPTRNGNVISAMIILLLQRVTLYHTSFFAKCQNQCAFIMEIRVLYRMM